MKNKKATSPASSWPTAEWLVDLSARGSAKLRPVEDDALIEFIRQTGLGAVTKPAKGQAKKNDAVEILSGAHLYALGICRDTDAVLRRAMALFPAYRQHLLHEVLEALPQLPDDQALADTLGRIDHLGPELLALCGDNSTSLDHASYAPLDAAIWRAPDAITLLTKVVERPLDLPKRPDGPNPPVCFDWLARGQRVQTPTPAPWGNSEALQTPLMAARHPFWGALTATLDACAGDHHWQVLDLRADGLRHNHVRMGDAQGVLGELWQQELGLFPAAPLLLPKGMIAAVDERPSWLVYGLAQMAEHGLAAETAGSWRLSDMIRRELMRDDERMQTFEAIRQRALALARAAGRWTIRQRGVAP